MVGCPQRDHLQLGLSQEGYRQPWVLSTQLFLDPVFSWPETGSQVLRRKHQLTGMELNTWATRHQEMVTGHPLLHLVLVPKRRLPDMVHQTVCMNCKRLENK